MGEIIGKDRSYVDATAATEVERRAEPAVSEAARWPATALLSMELPDFLTAMDGRRQLSDDTRRWYAEKEAKRDAALKALSTEADPKMQRKLRARARRYKAMIAMGPERTRAACGHSRYTQSDRD